MRVISRLGLALACLVGLAPTVSADSGHPRAPRVATASAADSEARVIVKYRADAAAMKSASAARAPRQAAALGKRLGLTLSDGHVLGERTQSIRARGLSSAVLAARLAAQPDVEWVEVVRRKTYSAVLPNDPLYPAGQTGSMPVAGQWYLRAPDATLVSATNAIGAWSLTLGSPSITVAVLDTGVRLDHEDLSGKLHPGYDFVSRTSNSVDGDGREADATDPGDWSTSGDSCGAADSSWHGTQVAGLIGAATDNGRGVAGLGRNVMLLPVRVLGKCGGYDDDIQAAMRWAAGLSNAAGCGSGSAVSATCNPNAARVINMSLGSSGSCGSSYQQVVTELVNAGVTVVVAAGNDVGHAVNSPANCNGALAVAGVRHAGTKVGYSNIGPQVAIAAPAGNCVNVTSGSACLYPLVTTVNAGTTVAATNTYSDSYNTSLGTSFAAPLVAGTAALMLSVDSTLTPARIKTALQATARTFPSTGGTDATVTACRAPTSSDQLECYCTTSTCGAGLLDAGAAVAKALADIPAPTVAITPSSTAPLVGSLVTLSATATPSGGRSIASYRWEITAGATLAAWAGAVDGASATLQTTGVGDVTVRLTVTDSAGASSTASQSIVIAAVPPPVARIAASSTAPSVGQAVTLDGSGSTASGGRTIASHAWAITAGNTLATLANATAATATLTTSGVGTVTVSLTVTDSAGASHTTTQSLSVTAAPAASSSGSGGGGGALGAGWLAGLALAVWALRRGRSAAGGRSGG